MNKKIWFGIGIVFIALVGILAAFKVGFKVYEDEKVKNAIIEVTLTEDLDVSFDSEVKLSDLVESINGKFDDDFKIDTTILGEKEIKFKYTNEDDIKVDYSFKINVIDDVSPVVWLGNDYYVTTAFRGALEDKILCADDHDDEPYCKVEGAYDTKKVGTYDVKFVARDTSGNETVKPFKLHVSKPSSGGGSSYIPSKVYFNTAIDKFKKDDVALGIDVSSWQGDLNFEKVKNAGVEFAFVRVGSKWGREGEFFLDSRFERNMKGFNEVGIPVGAYFYSYAQNEEEAKEEALWLIERLKDYKVDLPIAFDFEDWNNYNKYKMSLHRLNRNAEVFIETLESAGYEGMLYGSLNYLGKMWKKDGKTIWGAHYTMNADYEGTFDFWQFSASGRVDGIYADVDLNVWYKKGVVKSE